ncbi:MAG: hypothetical protein EAX96_09460 [Candidatus Lokiarchaeota archaeon]|nr:hypothetical protein [Candidatus Lokiarchaeota archaeon]
MFKKYSKQLSGYFEKNKDSNSMDYIAKEFLNLMKQKCEKCLRYRTECALNPHCKDRRYVNILIDMEVKPDDLPSFCYLQHKRSIENILKGKPNLFDPIDAKLYLIDFLQIVGVKKTLSGNMNRICSNLDQLLPKLAPNFDSKLLEDKKLFIFTLNDSLNLVDFNSEIVTINLKFEYPKSEEELKAFILLYQKMYHLDIEIIEEMWGWWYLKVIFPDLNELKERIENFEQKIGFDSTYDFPDLKSLKEKFLKIKSLKEKIKISELIGTEISKKLENLCDHVQYYEEDNKFVYFIDVKTPKSQNWYNSKFSVNKLKKIFEILAQLNI